MQCGWKRKWNILKFNSSSYESNILRPLGTRVTRIQTQMPNRSYLGTHTETFSPFLNFRQVINVFWTFSLRIVDCSIRKSKYEAVHNLSFLQVICFDIVEAKMENCKFDTFPLWIKHFKILFLFELNLKRSDVKVLQPLSVQVSIQSFFL